MSVGVASVVEATYQHMLVLILWLGALRHRRRIQIRILIQCRNEWGQFNWFICEQKDLERVQYVHHYHHVYEP